MIIQLNISDVILQPELNAAQITITPIFSSGTPDVNKQYVDEGLSLKVDKVDGKGLSTEDYTTAEKSKVANLPLDTNSELGLKVDKVEGKGLSTEDYTTAEKSKVANLPLDTNAELGLKVDKVEGKGLSTEDYTTAEKSKVANLPLDTNAELGLKVDKVEGNSLVPDAEINKLAEYPEFEDLEFSHTNLTDKNSEAAFQHLDTTQSKTTPIDADSVGLWDSVTNVFKRTTWLNIKATLKTYFDPLYEKLTNKQNSLTPDGTGTKFPTVDAVNAGLVANSNLLYQYIHSGNIEVYISAIDYVSHTFTSVGHGLQNGDRLGLKIIEDGVIENIIPFTADIPQDGFTTGYYVINATLDTFQIATTSGGSAITTINKATQNFSKWRFEKLTTTHITLPNIPAIGCEVEIIGDIMQMNRYVNENNYLGLSLGYIQPYFASTALVHANTYLLKGWYRISIRKTESSMFVNRKYVGIRLEPTNSARIKWTTGEIMMITHGNIPLIDNIVLTSVNLTNGTIINVFKI